MPQELCDGRDAVEADAQAHHVHLVLGEPQDTGRVEYVAQYLVFGVLLQVVGTAGEGVDLLVRELVEAGFVAAGKVREYRAGEHDGLVVENVDHAGHVLLFEAEPVHARVDFDVHGIAGQAQLSRPRR